MSSPKKLIRFYFDYKSPFSYLAKFGIYELQRDYNIQVQWLPFQFSVKDLFGLPEQRHDIMWRKVKYLYLDARRFANDRKIKILGPQKAFDSTISLAGALFIQHKIKLANSNNTSQVAEEEEKVFFKFTDIVFEQFFLRQLDIENEEAIVEVMHQAASSNLSSSSVAQTLQFVTLEEFKEFRENLGNKKLEEIQEMAKKDGVFGVPSVIVDGELFFGNDRLDWVRRRLDEQHLKKKEFVSKM